MPTKKKTKKKFIPIDSKEVIKTYRITFTCCCEGLESIREGIMGYGTIEKEEIEVDV